MSAEINKNVNINGLRLYVRCDPQISLSVSLINAFFWLRTSSQKSIWGVWFPYVKRDTLKYVKT